MKMKSPGELAADISRDMKLPHELRPHYNAPVFGTIRNGAVYAVAGATTAPLPELAACLSTRAMGSFSARPPVIVFRHQGEPTIRALAGFARAGVGAHIENQCIFVDEVASRCRLWRQRHNTSPSAIMVEDAGKLMTRSMSTHPPATNQSHIERMSHPGLSPTEERYRHTIISLYRLALEFKCPIIATLPTQHISINQNAAHELISQLGELAEFNDHAFGFAFLSDDGGFAMVTRHSNGPTGVWIPLEFDSDSGKFCR